jgi:hypothetical protein
MFLETLITEPESPHHARHLHQNYVRHTRHDGQSPSYRSAGSNNALIHEKVRVPAPITTHVATVRLRAKAAR